MTRRSRILAAAVLGLSVAQPLAGRAAEPSGSGGLPPLPAATGPVQAAPEAVVPATPPAAAKAETPVAVPVTNRQVAAAIADALRQAGKSGQLRYYNVDVAVKDGTAELTGTVANQPQREEALKLVKAVTGVSSVVDKMTLLAPSPITQVQATGPAIPALQPPPVLGPRPEPVPVTPEMISGPSRPFAPPNGVIPEPVPTFAAPMPSPYDLNPPLMPPYAWPTYAPYNNYSRVATPLAYPYQSWPFIGPCYPFPKIPLGWRSVKLEWQDGHWWFSRVATNYDWWRLRFW